MTKPAELVEAELINGMCRRYNALPAEGGVIDQPVWVLRMHRVLALAGEDEPREADPLAAFAMEIG